jgi:hypothetical protein
VISHLLTLPLRSLRELQGTVDYNAAAVQSVYENGIRAVSLESENLQKRLQEDLESGFRAMKAAVTQHANQGAQAQKHWAAVSSNIKGVLQTLDSMPLPNPVMSEGKRDREQEEDSSASWKKARTEQTE